MARRIESLFVAGPAGKIEALLEEPDDSAPVEAALVCHPHPQHGGTMHNKVVYRLARGLRKSGCVVLRFNYRGVNLSEGTYDRGVGEVEDARACLRALYERYPHLKFLCAGFSFGSRVAMRVAREEVLVERVVPVGFPTQSDPHAFLYDVRIPKYFVQSTHDTFGPVEELTDLYRSLPEPKHIDWVASVDHFFKDNLDGFEAVIERIGRTRP